MRPFPFLTVAADAPERGTLAGQRTELLSRFAAMQDVAEFQPGELVALKHGLGSFDEETRERGALLFLRAFDPTAPVDAMLLEKQLDQGASIDAPDCLLALISPDGLGLNYEPAQRAHLRHLTADERAELAAVLGEG